MANNKIPYNYNLLYLKYFSCLLVLSIHTVYGDGAVVFFVTRGIARIAVPIFFTISAYLYYQHVWSTKKEGIKHYSTRILRLMAMWGGVLLPYIICNCFYFPIRNAIQDGESIILTVLRLMIRNILCMQINGFWYLWACIICVCILSKTGFKHKGTVIFCCLVIELICPTLTNYFNLLPSSLRMANEWLELNVGTIYNSFIVAIPYFYLGHYLAVHKESVQECLFFRQRGLFLALSLLSLCTEIVFVYTHNSYKGTDCYFALLPVTYFVMLMALSNTGRKCNAKLKHYFEVSSTVMYVTQFAIIFVFSRIICGISTECKSTILLILTFMISNIISALIIKLEKQHHCLKLMY